MDNEGNAIGTFLVLSKSRDNTYPHFHNGGQAIQPLYEDGRRAALVLVSREIVNENSTSHLPNLGATRAKVSKVPCLCV